MTSAEVTLGRGRSAHRDPPNPGIGTAAVSRAAYNSTDHPVKAMAQGVERAIRRRPVYAVVVGVMAGFLVGCALSRQPRGDRERRPFGPF